MLTLILLALGALVGAVIQISAKINSMPALIASGVILGLLGQETMARDPDHFWFMVAAVVTGNIIVAVLVAFWCKSRMAGADGKQSGEGHNV